MKPCYLAFDFGGTRIKCGLVDNQGHVIARRVVPTEGERGARHVLNRMAQLGHGLVAEAGRQPQAVGIAFIGVLDRARGVVLSTPGKIPDLIGMAVGPELAARLGMPTFIENDGLAAIIGEWQFGAGRGVANLAGITIGTGIGSGVISGGAVLRTPGLLSGTLGGHLVVDRDGPLCGCGNRGCLEALASAPALASSARDHLIRGCASQIREQVGGELGRIDAQVVLEAAVAGDGLAAELVERWLGYLGAGLVNLVHAYDPDLLVLGGGVMARAELIIPPLQRYVARHAWTIPPGRVRVVAAALGDDAGVLGAAAVAGLGAIE